MKIYKKLIKAFGGSALYIDKCILNALNVNPGEEVCIEIKDNKVIITKPSISVNEVKELIEKVTKPSK